MTKNDPKTASRGEKTRAKILETSTKLFAKKGFHEVTTRKIAGLCPCNLAAIGYHFGGKDGLYRAVLEDVTHKHSQKTTPLLTTLQQQIDRAGGDKSRIAAAAKRFIEDIVRLFLTHPDALWIHDIIKRELTNPSKHATIISKGCVEPLNVAIRNLYCQMHNIPVDSSEAIISGKLIIAQISAPLTYKKAFLNDLGWDEFTPERVTEICDCISQSVLKILDLDHPKQTCKGTL